MEVLADFFSELPGPMWLLLAGKPAGVVLLGVIEKHYLESKAEAPKERLNGVHKRGGPATYVADGIDGACGQDRQVPVRDAGPVDEVDQALSQAHTGVRSTDILFPTSLARPRCGQAGPIEPGTLPEPLRAAGRLLRC